MSQLIKFLKELKNDIFIIFCLSFSLAKANFKLRNEGSYLGIFWYLLNPLMLFLIILFIRNQAFSYNLIPNYPIYLLIGLLFYNFFIHVVGASINIIPMNGGFIKSVRIPTESLVIARVLQSVFSHIFEFILIILSLIYFEVSLEGLLTYFVIFVFLTIFTLGVSFLFSTIGVYFSDLSNIWIAVSHFLFFITPIFYSPVAGSLLYKVNLFNPIYYFVSAGRSVFVYGEYPSLGLISCIVIISFSALIIGLTIFNRNKPRFAEFV